MRKVADYQERYSIRSWNEALAEIIRELDEDE